MIGTLIILIFVYCLIRLIWMTWYMVVHELEAHNMKPDSLGLFFLDLLLLKAFVWDHKEFTKGDN